MIQNCGFCGKEFANRNRLVFCSRTCFVARNIARKTRACALCGKLFMIATPCSDQTLCSHQCRAANLTKTRIGLCKGCGANFKYHGLGRREKKYCSGACLKEHFRGRNHPSFRGLRKAERGHSWGINSAIARDRDGNICQGCGGSGRQRSSVDHIIPFRWAVLYAQNDGLDPNALVNLIALCRRCHSRKTHAEYILLRGDFEGFRDAVREIIPSDRLAEALSFWKIGRQIPQVLPFEAVPSFLNK